MGQHLLEETEKAPGKRSELVRETFEFSFYDWPGNIQRSGRKKEKNKKMQSAGINKIEEQY